MILMKTNYLKISLLGLFLLYFTTETLAQLIVKCNEILDIPSNAEVLVDSSFHLNVDSFLQKSEGYAFKPNRDRQLFCPAGAVYWLRFQVTNIDSLANRRFIVVQKREIDAIHLYLVHENKVITHLQSGACVPYLQRLYPNARFWLPIALTSNTTYTVYLCLDSRYNNFSTSILYQSEHLEETVEKERKNSFMVGIAVFYLLFAIVLVALMHQKLLFYYLLYIVGGVGFLVSSSGFGVSMLWQNATKWDAIADSELAFFSILGLNLMSRQFLNTSTVFKKADLILKCNLAANIAVILVTFFKASVPQIYAWICLIASISFVVMVITLFYVSVVTYLNNRKREYGLFLFSFLCYLLIGLLVIATEFGLVKYKNPQIQAIYFNLPQYFLFFEMTIISYILSSFLRKVLTELQLKTIVSQQKIIHQRERISRDLHDDVGSTLNSISVYSDIAQRQLQASHPQTVLILENIGNSSRQLIDSMSDIVWAINPENDQFVNITQRMRMFVAQLLMTQNVKLHFEADARLNEVILSIEKRRNFFLIFKEAVNNVYKYAQCKTLCIEIKQQNGNIEMLIADDGCGFDGNNLKTGNGMKTMRHRADDLGGVFNITSGITRGTIIELVFPVKD
jgi:signal transduction histidine kinase